jgi:RNA polymerase sigma-70 factor (ECF subfamily)
VKRHDARTDEQLIHDARKGDHGAFTSLVKRHEDAVYRFSFKVCRDRNQAQEALQDTFISVYRNLDSFDGRSKLTTWLYRIVTNNCLMKRRRRKLDEVTEPLVEPDVDKQGKFTHPIPRWDETPADLLIHKEFRAILDQAIRKLPVEYRMVFVLRDVEGKTNEETANILKLSQEATKSRLRRARAFLREQLNPYMTAFKGVQQ